MRNRYISLVTVAGLILMSCSGDDSTSDDTAAPDVTEQTEPDVTEPDVTEPDVTGPDVTEPDVTGPDVTGPDVTEPDVTEPDVTEPEPEPERVPAHTVEMVGCEQVAIYLPIDATKARARVSADVDLVVEDDRVTSLFLAHECTDTAVDGVPSGAAHVIAQWLPVDGPDEVREGPQFEGAPVLPTAYWEPIYTATDNPTLAELMQAADLDMLFVESMTFDRMPAREGVHQVRSGTVASADRADEFLWASPNPWAAGDEVPYGDQPTGFVHIAGDLELEAVGNMRVANVPNSQLAGADGPNEPIADEPGQGGGVGFVTTFEHIRFETIT